ADSTCRERSTQKKSGAPAFLRLGKNGVSHPLGGVQCAGRDSLVILGNSLLLQVTVEMSHGFQHHTGAHFSYSQRGSRVRGEAILSLSAFSISEILPKLFSR